MTLTSDQQFVAAVVVVVENVAAESDAALKCSVVCETLIAENLESVAVYCCDHAKLNMSPRY